MEKSYYVSLAEKGLKMPIGVDLILHQKKNPEEILSNGKLLGKTIEESARKFNTPLAFPLMDLMLEKSIMLEILGIKKDEIETYHFENVLSDEVINTIKENAGKYLNERMKADIDAIKYIANETDLLPIGMSIGPISLLTKLVKDPITIMYIAGMGTTADEEQEVKMIEQILDISIEIILKYVELKISAGAKAILIAEPAANKVYFSPKQIEGGSDIFERYVLKYNLKIKELLSKNNIDLIFHCCGEITDYMLNQFIKLNPVVLSLGSSRVLWEDAKIVPKDIVLFGNLPSKKFFSDDEISIQGVKEKAIELVSKMKEAGHPFILGSECDVLSVIGCEEKISDKVRAFLEI